MPRPHCPKCHTLLPSGAFSCTRCGLALRPTQGALQGVVVTVLAFFLILVFYGLAYLVLGQ